MADVTEAQPREIVTRAQAKTAGLKKYFTGRPCPRGHVSFRSTADWKCMACVRERAASWYVANTERARTSRKKRRLENIETELATSRTRGAKWRRQYPERARAAIVRWEREHPEACRVKCRNRRARKRANGGIHTAAEIEALAERQKHRCANPTCRKSIREKRHADHRMPLILGGSNDIKNIQLLCPSCNLRKNAKHPLDFARENGMLL